jgi:hypothetical protein
LEEPPLLSTIINNSDRCINLPELLVNLAVPKCDLLGPYMETFTTSNCDGEPSET